MIKKINLTVSEENLRLIAMSLELQSRLLCGQFGEIDNLFRLYTKHNYNSDVVDKKLRELKREIFGSDNMIGIYSDEANGLALDGYELYKQILHYFHKDSKHWSVHKDEPLITNDNNKITIKNI